MTARTNDLALAPVTEALIRVEVAHRPLPIRMRLAGTKTRRLRLPSLASRAMQLPVARARGRSRVA